MADFGITPQGFVLKRLADISADMDTALSTVIDPVSGETLLLTDENDPLVQLKNSVADQLSAAWEVLQMAYNQFDPLKNSGAAQSGTVQLNGIIRRVNETDTELRLRQQEQTSLPSGSQVDAIYAAVVDVPGVKCCRIYVNSTLEMDDRGLPGKSFSAVVLGGVDEAVATAILSRTAFIADFFGDTAITLPSIIPGVHHVVKFQRPIPIPISIQISILVIDPFTWPENGVDQIKQNIVDYFGNYGQTGFPSGAPVILSRLYTPTNLVNGHLVSDIMMSIQGGSFSKEPIMIQWNEIAQFSVEGIVVNIL